jgi:hypothetical protein
MKVMAHPENRKTTPSQKLDSLLEGSLNLQKSLDSMTWDQGLVEQDRHASFLV